jgi:uncharacterized protein
MKLIDTRRFCQDNTHLLGVLSHLDLPRLYEEVLPNSIFEATWDVNGRSPDGMTLEIQTRLVFNCQRCLQPFDFELQVSNRLRFVKDEKTALDEDDASDEDILVHTKSFDLAQLIEDELLMALPLSPTHETCPELGVLAFTPQNDRLNPFAILKTMA